MSTQSMAVGATRRARSGMARLGRAARTLPPDRQLAGAAALGLFLSLFLPWYQETGFANGKNLQAQSLSLTGWHAFSWVEAAVLLVALGVLTLLFQRAEGRPFHLPGGDGVIVMIAGGWTCLLVIWRIFDKQTTTAGRQFGTTFGIKWGIFAALALAGLLAYAGTRIRAAHQPEPLLPGEEPAASSGGRSAREASAVGRRAERRAPAAPGAAAVAPVGAATTGESDARTARRAQRARRATWAEPVTWEESRNRSQPGWAAEPELTAEPTVGEDPTQAVVPPVGEEPTQVVEPTVRESTKRSGASPPRPARSELAWPVRESAPHERDVGAHPRDHQQP